MGGAVLIDHWRCGGDLTADLADRRDQLGHRALGGARIVEDGGIQGPPRLAGQRTGRADHGFDRFEDPVRAIRGRQPAPPVRQRRRVESRGRYRQAARCFPAQIEGHRIHGLVIGQTMQRLQRDHRRHHLGRNTRTPRRDGNRSANISSGNNSLR
jgi:hypothetical protein